MTTIPYRNFRHLLTLRAKESPEKPLLITYDAQGKREKIAYAEMIARIQQTANLLEDLGVKPGDSVALRVDDPGSAALIYYACWMMGAVVTREGNASVYFVDDPASQALPNKPVVQIGGTPRAEVLQFGDLVRQMATTYVEDKPATLDTIAIHLAKPNTDTFIRSYSSYYLSQRALLAGALSLANAQAITGNQTVMSYGLDDPVFALVLPLVTGVPSVICQTFSPETLWHRLVHEKVNIVQIHSSMLQPLLDYAAEQEPQGNLMFGGKIRRQELMRFRHFLSADIPSQNVMRDFEDKFGFAVMVGYKPFGVAGYAALPPVTLTWAERRQLAFATEGVYVGEAVEGCEVIVRENEKVAVQGINVAGAFFRRENQEIPRIHTQDDIAFVGEDGRSLFIYTDGYHARIITPEIDRQLEERRRRLQEQERANKDRE
jgi:acyl-CoA synthetase (AMP-forming)/AMP-acid ligase II